MTSVALRRVRARRRAGLVPLLGALTFALVLASAASAPVGNAAFPGANGKIAFGSGDGEIYVMSADGSGQTNLTNNLAGDGNPGWSADGAKITFQSNRDGNTEIYAMDADGTGQTRLTNNLVEDGGPSWSPDGTKIVFERTCGIRCLEIWVMNADGTGETKLVADTAPNHPHYSSPAWSPDGTEIALSRTQSDTNNEICVVSASDGSFLRCTNNGVQTRLPNWSPDGTKIAFDRGPAGTAEVHVMNRDLTGQTPLTSGGPVNQSAAWSPDGTKIVFVKEQPGDREIYVMNSDGSGQTRITFGGGLEGDPDWQPLDVTAPTIMITTPSAGANYTLGQVVLADYACQDQVGGTGLASCMGPVPHGSAIDTGSVGAKTFTVMASDNAGNTATLTHSYSVTYAFSGFFPPVDNPGPGPSFVFNAAKAGSAIPVKFSLNGDQGLNIFAMGYPKSEKIACDTFASLDAIEETATAGSSSLSYDATADQYVYVWKTDKMWASTCRKLIVRLNDGTDHVAYFNFKK